ncbi:hypothetical protein FBU30_004045 [Linnemannia zychae]|nr:hypothetical protein FBU30_004045 [Linnemannia zychae]
MDTIEEPRCTIEGLGDRDVKISQLARSSNYLSSSFALAVYITYNMRFYSASLIAAFVFALTFVDVAQAVDPNDPVVKACIRKCDVEQAKAFETAVKAYPDPKNAQRLRDIKWATVFHGHCISDCYDS